ncbi:MAG TPA: DUF2336 domain-containing protein [Aliidongia sp.]|uniref:DUF2336 domain-containing protein n=1 Tax=Aliidongia sp. TaxID=1914230 RepID=UPI002DDCDC31|nr:DUF2336 domain-containing protein [Aliidongia sp.]HEV2678361.1 DUF2336 domain-containing protein [Aliidongia sp.]
MKGLLQRIFHIGAGSPALDYEESKRLIQSRNPADRRLVAGNLQVQPEVLYFLATDPDHTVRTAVASNEATPVQADLILARDRHEAVRADLARKIARLAPTLTQRQSDRVKEITYEVLEELVRDQAVKIRRIVAETLKSMPDAPAEIVQLLARDAELSVAGPLLQYSPLLTDEDLLDLVRQMPIPGAVRAIAQRKGLSAALSAEIGTGEDIDAVTALLSNSSAQIREETLDLLIERAPAHKAWHRPLVERPRLSDGAARKLARFVAHDLIQRLKARSDLKADTVKALQAIVLARLEVEGGVAEEPASEVAAQDKLMEEARRLKEAGKLTESALVDALIGGKPGLVNAGLAVLAEQPLNVVEKILSSHSPKGITAIVWKAGLPMRFSVRLQSVVARIPAPQTLKPRADGGFPLSEEALAWQLGFFADMTAEGAQKQGAVQ